ncbi:MAG: UDP-N-acetylmuramate--L-alanine ligase [Christensenellaceae bacterium]|nr:UDP-N-acetylmuramate--L-alanine ligase [Christensenellaceae bacterium]
MIKLTDYKDKKIHFIGIGGCSMSGLAQILSNLGYNVDGSDIKESSFTKTLMDSGIDVKIGHDESYAKDASLIVYTPAIKPTNPEFAYAVQHDIMMIERAQLLGMISANYDQVVGVSGCHGKTTITSMLACITKDSGIDPTVHVGGMVDFLSGGVCLGNSDIFITEACEYVRSFMSLHPSAIILNNIDDDHLDYYKDIDEIIDAFVDFIALLPEDGVLFINIDDKNNMKALARCTPPKVVTYSASGNADYCIKSVKFDDMGAPEFDVICRGENLGKIKLNVPGMHNAANALAAAALAHEVFGISIEECAKDLADYHLAGRRFEKVGEKDGVTIFHDYAHHPSEIKACLEAAHNYPHRKLWVLFQCNSYTRARTLKDKYASAFDNADMVLVPDIYPGRDIDTGDIHARDLVSAINAHSNNCVYLPTFREIRDYLRDRWQPGDIVLTLGSGDVNKQQLILLDD